jgi:hypothetical protein
LVILRQCRKLQGKELPESRKFITGDIKETIYSRPCY